jgi:GT2 family glycosyltransferase
MIDLSVMIVGYRNARLVRQTLKGIRRAAPALSHEILLSENDPTGATAAMARAEFPEVRVVQNGGNIGFGAAMNRAIEAAVGRYLLVFNPDIVVMPGAFEELVRYLDANPEVGVVGPRLRNPDGRLQHSCYRFMEPKTVLCRRLPFVRRFASVRRHLDEYTMADWDHAQTREVDYLLGAAMLLRREALDRVGGFDEAYFMYFEDQDLCRRLWKAGWKVAYHPGAELIHYHRRETADGHFLRQLAHPLTRVQIKSALYYFKKYRGERNPRTPRDVTKDDV